MGLGFADNLVVVVVVAAAVFLVLLVVIFFQNLVSLTVASSDSRRCLP